MKKLSLYIVLSLVVVMAGCSPQTFYYRMSAPPEGEGGISFYRGPAAGTKLAAVPAGEVRNVIVCIGDGMGFNQVELARGYAGPSRMLWMDTMPVRGQVATRSANKRVTDSAAGGTALACGIKTNNGMIGMNPDEVPYASILERLEQKGWRSGLVATSAITHATPASFASHIDSRDKQDRIAEQLLTSGVDVMLGGGQKFWTDDMLAQAANEGYQVIDSREQLAALKPAPVVGMFANDGMTTFSPEPLLQDMAGTAIMLLSSRTSQWFTPEPKFFLMIEGSQIDWAGHANDTDRMVRQALLFDMAVREALNFAKRDGHTLVIVTADHETGGLQLDKDDNPIGVKGKWTSGNHTGVNVPLFAYGPGAEKFAGTLDNTEIPKRIADLTGAGPFPAVRTAVVQQAMMK